MTGEVRDDLRIDLAVGRGERIEIEVDGDPVVAFEGESVASALWAAGINSLRTTDKSSSPRGIFCNIGVCHDCIVTVDGYPNQRACRTQVADGMTIKRQTGFGEWL